MRLDYAFFARVVEFDSSSAAFHVLCGGLDRITTPCLPATVPNLTLLAHVVSDKEGETDEYELKLESYTPDGEKHYIELTSSLKLPRVEGKNPPIPNASVAFIMQGLQLPKAGKYEFKLSTGDTLLGVIPLCVEVQK